VAKLNRALLNQNSLCALVYAELYCTLCAVVRFALLYALRCCTLGNLNFIHTRLRKSSEGLGSVRQPDRESAIYSCTIQLNLFGPAHVVFAQKCRCAITFSRVGARFELATTVQDFGDI
jgi:hypothetical protein